MLIRAKKPEVVARSFTRRRANPSPRGRSAASPDLVSFDLDQGIGRLLYYEGYYDELVRPGTA
ncbi:MAG TPA: hypothetical protein VIH63_12430, partial [Xanthobacteraceae bacterium]